MCKILESLIRDAMVIYMKENYFGLFETIEVLSEEGLLRSNFWKSLTNELDILDKGSCMDVINCDSMKPFNTVPHGRHTQVLHYYGFDVMIINWVKDFLSHRKQQGFVNGPEYSWFYMKRWIPQGYMSGPVLFAIYISNVVEKWAILMFTYIYADDTKVFHEIVP